MCACAVVETTVLPQAKIAASMALGWSRSMQGKRGGKCRGGSVMSEQTEVYIREDHVARREIGGKVEFSSRLLTGTRGVGGGRHGQGREAKGGKKDARWDEPAIRRRADSCAPRCGFSRRENSATRQLVGRGGGWGRKEGSRQSAHSQGGGQAWGARQGGALERRLCIAAGWGGQ